MQLQTADAYLLLELWDQEKLVRCADTPLHNLAVGTSHEVQVGEGCVLRICLHPEPLRQKTLYLIRHAESEWNKATEGGNLTSPLSTLGTILLLRDHGLSETGRDQAEALHSKLQGGVQLGHPLYQEFQSCPVVASSPFTRAIQTTCIALAAHKTVQGSGIRLVRDVREMKNATGMDSVGVAVGGEIRERVATAMEELYNGKQQPVPQLDVSDASTEWWTEAANQP